MTVDICEGGHGADETGLHLLEEKLGCRLPEAYRTWLSHYDGGRPASTTFDVDGHPEGFFDVQVFFGLNRRLQSSRLGWNIDHVYHLVKRGFLPIACTCTGDLLVLILEGEGVGHVLFVDSLEDDRTWYVAESFADFLDSLREPRS